MDDGKIWITTKNGNRVLIDTHKYMNNFIRQSNDKTNTSPKKLSDLEYNVLCEEFADSLTDEEKEILNSYGTGGRYSYHLNDPQMLNFERTFRYKNEDGTFREEKIALKDIFDKQYDKTATYAKTGNTNYDENIVFNYERTQDIINSVNTMDKIFNEKGISLDKDIIVHRKGFESLEDIQNGYIRKGYTSTTAGSRINKKTPGGLKLGDNEFEIIVPAGMKFLPIKNLVSEDVQYQKEILLPRNIQYELIENKSTGGWNKEKLSFDKKVNKYLVKAKQV